MAKPISHEVSKAITIFTFLATLLVVMCHTDDVMPAYLRTMPINYLGGAFSDANVCNFFFLSGFLLARHFGERGWWRAAIRSRLITLAVPYIAWCTIYVVLNRTAFAYVRNIYTAFDGGMMAALTETARSVRRIYGIGPLISPSDFALWYIKTLFYFVLVSGIAFPLLLKSRWRTLAAIASIYLFYCTGKYFEFAVMPYFGFCFHLIGFGAFLAGGYLAIHGIDKLPEKWRKVNPLVPLFIWGSVSLAYFWLARYSRAVGAYGAPINIATAISCLVWISFGIKCEVLPAFSCCTFFIYAAHLAVLRVMSKLIPPPPIVLENACASWMASLFVFSVLVAASIVISCGGAHLIHLCNPRLAKVLSGGRFEKDIKRRMKQ